MVPRTRGSCGLMYFEWRREILALAILQHLLQFKGHAVGSRVDRGCGWVEVIGARTRARSTTRSFVPCPAGAPFTPSLEPPDFGFMPRSAPARPPGAAPAAHDGEGAAREHDQPEHRAGHVRPAPGRHDGLRRRPERADACRSTVSPPTGVRFSRVSCQGPLCMPSRASFMTERYVRDHGVFTNWEEIPADSPTYVRALREAGYHTALLGKAHLYLDENLPVAHMNEMARPARGARVRRGLRDRRQVHAEDPDPLQRLPGGRGPARRLQEAHRRPQLPGRERGPARTPPSACRCGTRRRCPSRSRSYVDTWHGAQAVRWIEDYERDAPFFLFVGFPGPHDPWDAPAEAVARYDGVDISMPASTKRPVVEGTGRYGALLRGFLWALGLQDDDRRRHPRHAAVLCGRHLGDRHAVGGIVGALAQGRLLDSTWIVYTRTTARWPGATGSCRSACCTSRRCACR